MYDGVQLFAKAFNNLSQVYEIYTRPVYCNASNPWEQGARIIQAMKTVL